MLVLDTPAALLRRPRRPHPPGVRVRPGDRRGHRRPRAGGRAAVGAAHRRRRPDAAALPGRGAPGHRRAWCSRSIPGWSPSTASSWGWRPPTALRVGWPTAGSGWRTSRPATRDLVVGDAFGGLSVPWQLTTREAVELVDRALADDGVYAVNLIDHPPLGFVRAELATLRRGVPARAAARPGAGRCAGRTAATSSPSPRARRCRPTAIAAAPDRPRPGLAGRRGGGARRVRRRRRGAHRRLRAGRPAAHPLRLDR